HCQNRVHRDLKPDNIMMTADGTPKILDFGLARIIDPDPSSSGNARAARDAEDTSSDALTRMDERESAVSAREGVPSLTRGGQLIGTPQYMSPEQAEGEPMDARTDLFSVGVVMYEALTGRRPFEGKTLESIIGRIIEVEPAPVAALKPSTPYALGWLIRRCLRKKRDDRIQSARELLADLREIREEVESGKALVELGSVSQAEPNRRGGRPSLPWVVGALMLAGVAGLASRLSAPEPERAVRRFVLPAERLPTGIGAEVSGPSVSPDGKKVAYIDEDSLWIRDLDQVEPRPIAGTVGAYSPFWSSDSATVGYAKGASAAVTFQGNALWKVSVDGSSNVKICDLEGILSRGTWGRGGEIAFDTYSDRKRLFTVSERGGTPQLLLESPVPGRNPRIDYLHAFYLPDSNALLVARTDEAGSAYVEVREGESSRRLEMGPDTIGDFPAYSRTGHILFDRPGPDGQTDDVWATPFSLASMAVTGRPFLVAQNATHASVSSDGTLVVQAADSEPIEAQQLVWVDRGGSVLGTIGQPQYRIRNPVLSPDQRRVAVCGNDKDGNGDIWLHETDRPVKMRLTSRAEFDEEASWSPDGTQIVWASEEILTISVDAPDNPRRLVERGSYPSYSPDGRFLVYHAGTGSANARSRDLWYLPLAGNAEPVPYLQTEFEEGVPALSPDGRTLAYVSDESGEFEVYLQRFPERGNKTQVSVEGGLYPRWSGAGDEIFFVTGNTLMVAKVETRDGLRVGAPTALFDGDDLDAVLHTGVNLRTTYDVARDGQRFVVVQDIKGETSAPIVVVENWYEAFRNQQ
ncbi:MAG TPA: protein kinase, partial [Vicinamibacteria bacterium]|nr:protein kinase [Vicinamibacteria bacterium]